MKRARAIKLSWLSGLAFTAMTLTSGVGIAQSPQLGLHDDLSGSARQVGFSKTGLLMGLAEAELAFDVAYEYKASTLMGEPILLCSARLTNPTGTVRFVRDRAVHEVEVTPDLGELINPHHLDLLVSYSIAPGRFLIAKCSTGIPGTTTRDPLNLATSPSWGAFLCNAPTGTWGIVAAHHSGRPHPDMLDHNWCARYGGRLLESEEAQALFRDTELRANGVIFGSLSVNVGDLVQEAGRRLTAKAVADQLAEELYGARPSADDPVLVDSAVSAGWQAVWGQIDANIKAAAREPDPRARARAMQEAVQKTLRIQVDPSDPVGAAVRAYQAELANSLSSLQFQSFTSAERTLTESLDASAGAAAARAEQTMANARAEIAGAPPFRFAGAEPGLSSLLILIDVSGSMDRNDRIGAAKRAAKETIRRAAARGATEFAVFSFTGSCSSPSIRNIPFGRDVSAAERFIDSLSAGGGTPLRPSLGIVNRYLATDKDDASESQQVILLADGDDDCGGVPEEIEKLREENVLVRHETIGVEVTGSEAEIMLREIAEETGGSYHDAASPEMVVRAFENVIMSQQLNALRGRFRGKGEENAESLLAEADSLLMKAHDYVIANKWSDADDSFNRIFQLPVASPSELHYFHGWALYNGDQFDRSESSLSRYLEIAGEHGSYYDDALSLKRRTIQTPKIRAELERLNEKLERIQSVFDAQVSDKRGLSRSIIHIEEHIDRFLININLACQNYQRNGYRNRQTCETDRVKDVTPLLRNVEEMRERYRKLPSASELLPEMNQIREQIESLREELMTI